MPNISDVPYHIWFDLPILTNYMLPRGCFNFDQTYELQNPITFYTDIIFKI